MSIMLYAIPAFFLLIGLELLVARLRRTRLYSLPDAVTNMSCGIQQQVTGVLFKTILFTGYVWVYENRLWTIPETWWSFALVFLGVDFFYYWFHRSTHEISVLWGTHIVHHQSEEYNLSVALRQSAIQAFASNVFYLPLAFAGFSPASFLVMATFQTLYQFWIHTRMIGKMHPVFEYLFNTPSHHRVHHGINPKYIDRNHGGTLIVFDRWFGTFQAEEEEPVYGVTVPLASWNPVWAQVDYYAWLGQRLSQASTWADRLRMLFQKPGWLPASLGGSVEAKPVTAAEFHKFEIEVSPRIATYVLAQFVLLLVVTFLFLKTTGSSPGLTPQNLALTGWIVWTTGSLGGLLEGRKWGWWSEVGRWAVAAMLIIFIEVGCNGQRAKNEFPIFLQETPNQCGPACLKMIVKYYGQDIELSKLQTLSKMDERGTTLLGLSEAADSIGLKSLGVQISFKQLVEDVPLPAILHWDNNHFVVIYQATKNKINIADPAKGEIEYSKEAFCEKWFQSEKSTENKGAALLLETTDKFFKKE